MTQMGEGVQAPGAGSAEQAPPRPGDVVVHIGRNDSVMQRSAKLLPILSDGKRMVLRAKGIAIPNAVAVANILMERMLKNYAEIRSITLDSESPPGIGRMVSTIEIVLAKRG